MLVEVSRRRPQPISTVRGCCRPDSPQLADTPMRERPSRCLRSGLGRRDDELDIVSRCPAETATRPVGVQRGQALLVEPGAHLPHPIRPGLNQPGVTSTVLPPTHANTNHRPAVTHHAHHGLAAPTAHNALRLAALLVRRATHPPTLREAQNAASPASPSGGPSDKAKDPGQATSLST